MFVCFNCDESLIKHITASDNTTYEITVVIIIMVLFLRYLTDTCQKKC